MRHRRLVGIDLGIASAHTVRLLDECGETIAKRKCWPTTESLAAVETAALAGAPVGTRLEVIIEPTGPAWMPIAVFHQPGPPGIQGELGKVVGPAQSSSLDTPRPTGSTPTPSPGWAWWTRPGCRRFACSELRPPAWTDG